MQKKSPPYLALALLCASAVSEAKTQSFVHGQPITVICAVMHVCDIELQAGEYLTDDVKIGDPAHWSITPAITDSPNGEIHHLVVRPLDIDIETSVVALTNKRTYHISLRSDLNRYMPRVTFTYPEEERQLLKSRLVDDVEIRRRSQLPGTSYFLGDLDFQYRLDGDTNIKPLRVYNNGIKTTIELSPAADISVKPILVIPAPGKGPQKTLDYVLQDGRMIINGVFDEADLIYGAGNSRGTVRIERLSRTSRGPMIAGVTPAPPVAKTPEKTTTVALAAPASQRLVTATPGVNTAPAVTVQPTAAAPAAELSPALPPKVIPAKSTPTTAPVQSAPKALENWTSPVGSTLRQTVELWASRANWHVDWKASDLDYPIEAPLHFEGSFETAIQKLFPLYDKAERSFVVSGSRSQRLLIISEKTTRNPQ